MVHFMQNEIIQHIYGQKGMDLQSKNHTRYTGGEDRNQ